MRLYHSAGWRVETGVGDLITADHVGCTLIEFKKDRGTIGRELDKYKLTQAQRAAGGHYAKAVQLLAPRLFSMPGAPAHYIGADARASLRTPIVRAMKRARRTRFRLGATIFV